MGIWGDTYNRKLAQGHDHGSAAYSADQAEERAKAKVTAERKADLEKQLYVPGKFRCARCGFESQKMSMDAATGVVHPQRARSEPCPNCDVPLWPVTWEADAKNAWHCLAREMARVRQLEQQLWDEGIEPLLPEED